jgi:hypothetical protein
MSSTPLVLAQLGASVVTQFVEFGTIGVLLMLLALIINGTFRLRREVNGLKEDRERELHRVTEERDYWRTRASELGQRLERWVEDHERQLEMESRKRDTQD